MRQRFLASSSSSRVSGPGRLDALAWLLATVLVGCGGGSSGPASVAAAPPAAPAPEPSTLGFENRTFADFGLFEGLCENPRSGNDPDGRPWPDVQGTFVDENNWLRSWHQDRYLWFDEIEDVDPASLPTPEYFEVMKTFERTPAGRPKDRFHFTQPTDDFLAFQQSGVSAGYGFELAVLAARPPREIRVAFTDPGTPAAAQNVARGAEILTVDGVDVRQATTQAEVDAINDHLFSPTPGASHVLGIVDRGATEPREITLVAEEITRVPVQGVRVLDTASGPVGYLAFHDHIATAEAGLVEAIIQLRDAEIVDLVVDLRYNGGGLLGIAAQFGTMVAGASAAAGRTFSELEFNAKHQVFNPFTGRNLEPELFPTTRLGFAGPSGAVLPSVALERVFVLTGPGTCSASEVFLNALRGVDVEVVQIGAGTCGKPYGFYPTDNCGTTYFSIHFRSVNDKGWGDFADGFAPGMEAGPDGVVPGCTVDDDFGHALGDPLEARLAAALAWRETGGGCPVAATADGAGATGLRIDKGAGTDLAVEPPAWREGAWMLP